MSIWFLLWLLLSATLLFFLGWTLSILWRQKAAWKQYGQKKGLRYNSESMMGPPSLEGVLEGYTVALFASEHTRRHQRVSRKLTAIEVTLHSQMPFAGGIASDGMVVILKEIGFTHEVRPAFAKWPKGRVVMADDKDAMERYLTKERAKALLDVMKFKHAWGIFAFRDEVCVLRLDMPQALETMDSLDEVLSRMVAAAKVLELQAGEEADVLSGAAKGTAGAVKLDDAQADDDTGLELDDSDE